MKSRAAKPAYRLSVDAVCKKLQTSPGGLTSRHAAIRLEKQGENVLIATQSESLLARYGRQYKDWMVLLLMVSCGFAAYLGDTPTAAVLAGLIFFNTAIGFFQEYRAERTMQALEKLVQPLAEVYRDGKITEIESRQLVVGDVIRLSEGQRIPADVRVIESMAFATNDFALTGESNPTRKFTHAISKVVPMANRHNLAYMGTTVATGEARGIVTATSMNTELGRIAQLTAEAPRGLSPLQIELRHIATYITYGVVALTLVLLMVAIAIDMPFKDAMLFAVGFACALIPQGLPAEVNTALAQSAGRLSRAKALIKKLSAVETLGATQIICTDKTGTLTKNEMTVESLYLDGATYSVTGTGYAPKGSVEFNGKPLTVPQQTRVKALAMIGLFASNARVQAPDAFSRAWYCLGDPTEGALMTLASKVGIDTETTTQRYKEIRELPFDSGRKRMTSIRTTGAQVVAYVKGAPEAVLERSTHILIGGVTRPLTDADRAAFLAEHTVRAEQALRNIALATRTIDKTLAKAGTIDTIETDLTIVGMVSMIDPLRDEVPAAMRAARAAHIKVNIVTGDFALTAQAVARKAQLVGPNEVLSVVTGEQLADLSDAEVLRYVRQGGTIFSRVSPEDKMRIVGLAKDAGNIIAVTGDGINDAPALKRADIGVAMGITGTDVAKQSAEVVLLDDSFSTLVRAIRQGRTIFANIKKGVLSCLTSNAAELVVSCLSLFLAAIAGVPIAINVLQILAIDLLAELFPIAALGWDKEEGETMKRPPRDPKKHILNRRSILDIAWSGSIIGTLAVANYLWFFARNDVQPSDATQALIYSATTITYATIVICQLVNIIQRRSTHGFFTAYQLHNRYFWGAIVLAVGILLSIMYIPALSTLFRSAPLTGVDWLYVLAAASVFLCMRELQRLIARENH